MVAFRINRRRFLGAAGAGVSGLALSGCDAFDVLSYPGSDVRHFIERANDLTYRAQRLVIGADGMAQEFPETAIRQQMRPNGVTRPDDPTYQNFLMGNFTDFRLEIGGLVDRPQSLSLDELMAMPSRTQITRHDCVEGWSCIAKWTGVPLGHVLDLAGAKPQARFVVFHCLDTIERSLSGEVKYYESIDMLDARHPQTILACGMNNQRLPVENGAPLRVRVERQLGYKMAKYIHSIELVDTFGNIGFGKGGYWEDRGYDWYAGI